MGVPEASSAIGYPAAGDQSSRLDLSHPTATAARL